MDANRMPGDAEADAAGQAMAELYGRKGEHAVGDSVTFKLLGWSTPRIGRIERISGGRLANSSEYLIKDSTTGRTWLVAETEISRV